MSAVSVGTVFDWHTGIVAGSRRVGIDWDLVISCGMIGTYKTERMAGPYRLCQPPAPVG